MVKKRVVKSPVKFEKKPEIDPKTGLPKGIDPMQFEHPAGPGAPVPADPQEVGASFKDYLNVFEFSCVLPTTKKKIKFKPITVGGLKKLLSSNINSEDPKAASTGFNKVFEQCILSDIDVSDLTLPERFFLLVEIRKASHGSTNEYQIKCPECKSQSQVVIDLNKLPLIAPENPYDEIELTPQLSITMRHITHKNELEVYDIWEQIKDDVPEDEREAELSTLLEAQAIDKIITPNGEEDVQLWDKKYLLDKLPTSLYEKITDWHVDNYTGYDFNVKLKCKHCDFERTVDITKSDFFS